MTINPAMRLQQLSMLRGTQPPIPQQSQPVQDPRMQALQQYMQMKGARQPPNMPQQMPNDQGGTRAMTLPENQQAVEGMEAGQNEAYPNDTNAYYRDPTKDATNIDQERDADEQEQDELNTAEDRVPTYVDNQGQPSPNKDYSDENLLQGVNNRIDREEFTGDLESDKRRLIANPSDTNVEDFVAMHGEENLPDDLQEPDVSDPSGNR